MIIGKGSLTGGWQVEQSGIEYIDMMSTVKVEDKSIVISVAAGKESGVSSVIIRMYHHHQYCVSYSSMGLLAE